MWVAEFEAEQVFVISFLKVTGDSASALEKPQLLGLFLPTKPQDPLLTSRLLSATYVSLTHLTAIRIEVPLLLRNLLRFYPLTSNHS